LTLPGSSRSSALASNAHSLPASGSLTDPNLLAERLAVILMSLAVRYILDPQVPPRGPLAALSDLYIVTSEDHLVEALKPQQAQCFVPPRNHPW